MLRLMRRVAILVFLLLVAFIGFRIWESERGAPLRPWHEFAPPELDAAAIDAADWPTWLAAEARTFEAVRREVTEKLEPDDRYPGNRYFAESPLNPARFAQDFNRSYLLEPDGQPRGAVVLLHGLTDSPYSLRHVGRLYRDRGFVVVAIRLPGHGTVPAGLAEIGWEDWMAATRLAVREALRRAPPPLPLHIVGFSNGGALAMKHALDALQDPRLGRPDQVVLISPMIGITEFARFAGLAGLPAMLPRFARAAWLGVVPEFNPFKYNSFPVNGARQSWRLTSRLQAELRDASSSGRIAALAPVLTFQSVVDFTVSTLAVLRLLYAQLPPNGSEIVLFDINRATKLGPLLSSATETALERILPAAPRDYGVTVVANASADRLDAVAHSTPAAGDGVEEQALDLGWPAALYSLSHVALPFPMWDSLYGMEPPEEPEFGVRLGAIAARGERGLLLLSLDALVRASSNPFFPYMMQRIAETIPP
jgi:alpha-beta hydrolase superfamily lysophospholipase